MARLAATSLGASILLGLDVRIPVIEIPTPHVLAPLLQVDGEYAYDADVFEIYCELWLFVAVLFGVAMIVSAAKTVRTDDMSVICARIEVEKTAEISTLP